MNVSTIVILCSHEQLLNLKIRIGDIAISKYDKIFNKPINIFYMTLPEKYQNYYNNFVFNTFYAGYIYSKVLKQYLGYESPRSFVIVQPYNVVDPNCLLREKDKITFLNYFYSKKNAIKYDYQMSLNLPDSQYTILNKKNTLKIFEHIMNLIESGISKEEFFKLDFSYFIDKYSEKERVFHFYKNETFDVRKWSNYVKLCEHIMNNNDDIGKYLLEWKLKFPRHRMKKISYNDLKINDNTDYVFSNSTKYQDQLREELKQIVYNRQKLRAQKMKEERKS